MTETSDTSSNPSSTGRQPAVGDPQETGGQPAVDNQGGQESNETPEANERQRSAVPNQEDIQDQEFQDPLINLGLNDNQDDVRPVEAVNTTMSPFKPKPPRFGGVRTPPK